MQLLGLEIRRKESPPPVAQAVDRNRGGWFPIIGDWYSGAWQRDDELRSDTLLAFSAMFACISLIAADFGKLRPKLVLFDKNGIWTETQSNSFSPVLKKPNRYQNHIQFKEWWMLSKLIHGNAYALKARDQRGVVVALYLLDPTRVTVLVAPDGSVFYRLNQDNLSGLQQGSETVPASEILHDRMNCLFHPLVGISPIYACGVAANVGLKIQRGSSRFFGKGANPSGVLTAPGEISDEDRDKLVEHWNTQYSGENSGAVAILGMGLKFEQMSMKSVDAQLVEQLKMSETTVCSCFHVPPFKIGIGSPPTYANAAESLNQVYYADCLQSHIESFELVMDEGLGLTESKDGKIYGVELDLTGLIRMDTGAQITSLSDGIRGALLTPNEARKQIDKPPLDGGDTVYLQQQQYGIEAIHERDQDKPFAKPVPGAPGAPGASGPPSNPTPEPPKPDPKPAKSAPTPQERTEAILRFRSGVREKAA